MIPTKSPSIILNIDQPSTSAGSPAVECSRVNFLVKGRDSEMSLINPINCSIKVNSNSNDHRSCANTDKTQLSANNFAFNNTPKEGLFSEPPSFVSTSLREVAGCRFPVVPTSESQQGTTTFSTLEANRMCDDSSNTSTSPKILRNLLPPPINTEGLIALSPFPIHSSYVVKEKIGQGTWGTVHLAVERSSGLERAVKKIPKRFTTELVRFRQEMTFLKGLDHPNIVKLYETFEDYANIYMVLEYCRGGELFERVTHSKYFSEASAASLMHQMLSCTCYIHRKNIAHRDMKPENFLFLSSAERSPMKLIDFGLAKRFHSRRTMRTKVGTLYYVAPEVLSGQYTEKCDIWSAGVIMYLLLCGSPPFNGPTDTAIISQVRNAEVKFRESIWKTVSPLARDLVTSLLRKDIFRRPSAADALRHPWFTLFSPPMLSSICLPRPLSMPCLYPGSNLSYKQSNSHSNESLSAHVLRTTPAVQNQQIPPPASCELSVVGTHSPFRPKSNPTNSGISSPTKSFVAFQQSSITSPIVSTHASYNRASSSNSIGGQQILDRTPCCNVDSETVHRKDSTASTHSIALAELDILQELPRFSSEIHLSSSVASLDQWNTDEKTTKNLIVFGNLAKKLIPKWKRFAMHNQLKRAALRVVAHQLYDGDELEDLRTFFLALDAKNDGALTADEVASGVNLLNNATTKDIAPELTLSRSWSAEMMEEIDTPSLKLDTEYDQRAVGINQRIGSLNSNSTRQLPSDHLAQHVVKSTSSPRTSFTVSSNATRESPAPSNLEISSSASDRSLLSANERLDYTNDNSNVPLNVEEMKSLVSGVALNGGDMLEYSDFLAATMDRKHYNADNVLRAAFRVFDRDGDGKITPAKLRAALGWVDPLTMVSPGSSFRTRTENESLRTSVDNEIRNILETCDNDGDGFIGFEDFARVLRGDADVLNEDSNELPSS